MEQELLKNLVNVQPSAKGDLNAPYSFLEWKSQKLGILEKDLYLYYNRYVLEWFANNKEKKVSTKFLLRQKYLFLLDQLQLFFTTEEKNTWYNKINFSNEKELLLGIPYFAKKLKRIALYYLKLRKRLKNIKIKYNSVGSIRGIEQEIYQHIIENFSSSNVEFDPEFQDILPNIDILKNQLVVKVEEIYDDGSYLDKSDVLPLSSYVNIFHEPTAKFFSTKGLTLSSDDWIFNTFSFPASSTIDSFVEQLTSTIFEQTSDVLYSNYIEQYIAENKTLLTFQDSTITTQTYEVPLQQGNNYFFYPSGTTDTSLSIETPLTPVSLSSLKFEQGTSGSTLSAADTIFVKNGDDVKAAWLYNKQFEEEDKTVLTLINNSATTSFIFPFPGYGLSAEDIEWTGATLETEDEYQFLPPAVKASVNEAYWSQVLPADSTNIVSLNETTLAEDGARAAKDPELADNFFIRTNRTEDTTIPRGSLSGAWLYRFEQAALPISTTTNDLNVVLWPYCRTDRFDNTDFLNYTTKSILSGVCDPVSVQDLDCSYFVAASSFELADKIYVLESYSKTTPSEATECCWLSSGTSINGDYKYFNQKGISFLFSPTQPSRFIWTGPTMPLSSAFVGIEHDSDCPHYENKQLDWQECSCKQVYYSPFGRSGNTFEQANKHADYLCEVSANFSQEFDLDSWVDQTGSSFQTSGQFAWYKTQSNWGGGTWSKSDGSPSSMMLVQGKPYIYRRAGSRTEVEHPPYAALKKFYKKEYCSANNNLNEPQVKWISAKKLDTGEWVSADQPSQLILSPGDIFNFSKQKTTTSYYLSTVDVEVQPENKGSIWTTFDYIPYGADTNLNWPTQDGLFLANKEGYDDQLPPLFLADLVIVFAWEVTRIHPTPQISDIMQGSVRQSPISGQDAFYIPISNLTFVPPSIGTYSVSVTAFDAQNTKYIIGGPHANVSTTIPLISVVSPYSQEKVDIAFNVSQASVMVEHPLSGWNYSVSDVGAKPYWAVLDSEKNSSTKFKGIKEWGYDNTFFDSYIPNALPKMSPIEIHYGDVIDYHRKGRQFYWSQPVVYKTFVNQTEWRKLLYDTSSPSNLSSTFDILTNNTLKVFPTVSATDIVLSNNLNGAPVEVYYYALSSFVWTISADIVNEPAEPLSEVYYNSSLNGLNLANRFYPSIAILPTLEKTYTESDVGSYYTSQNLGASQYINTNFVANLKNPELTGTYITEDVNIHIGGRGLTFADQPSLYDWNENNEWLKESPVTNDLAGTVKKELTKALQTFIPYQVDTNALGLVVPDNKFSPWGGDYSDQWTDKTNEPISYTGVRNVSAWVESQELAKTQLQLDAWVNDIYGNQYGLFKELSGVPIWQRPDTAGDLWVKTNGGAILPATKALSSLFVQFTQSQPIYNQLTSKEILNVDCFFDTLMVQTSSALILGKISYDYDSDGITFNTDDTRYKQLTSNVFEFDQTWFLPQEKSLVCMFTEISGNSFFPNLYTYNLNTSNLIKIFPITNSDYTSLAQVLSSYEVQSGKFCYNSSVRSYGITYHALSGQDLVFVNIRLNRLEDLEINSINVYQTVSAYQMPPVVLSPYLSAISVDVNQPFSINVSALNNPSSYELIQAGSGINQVSVNSFGTFTGTLTSAGLYHINYTISNSVGSTHYCLTLSAT